MNTTTELVLNEHNIINYFGDGLMDENFVVREGFFGTLNGIKIKSNTLFGFKMVNGNVGQLSFFNSNFDGDTSSVLYNAETGESVDFMDVVQTPFFQQHILYNSFLVKLNKENCENQNQIREFILNSEFEKAKLLATK